MYDHLRDKAPKYRLEKLSIGFVSVMFGFLVFTGNNGVASANTANNNDPLETASVGSSTGATTSQNHDVAGTSLVTGSATSSSMISQRVGSQASRVSETVSETNNDNNEQNRVASYGVPMQSLKVRSMTSNPSNNQIRVSAVQDKSANGGFDQTTWGMLDVSKWTGKLVSNVDIDGVTRQYYQLTGYTGDMNHIIVPNEADLEAAGINTGGHQVGINADTSHSWFEDGDPKTIAFSKTDNKMVKALGSNWASAFTGKLSRYGSDENRSHSLIDFDGANLNVNNVSNIDDMFYADQISDLTSLSNWNVSNITTMKELFYNNRINNLTPLASWDVSNVIDMNSLFENNQINDLQPLSSWRVGNVADMSVMFSDNQIGDLEPLSNWKVSNVTDMTMLFSNNQISDVTPLTNWKVNNVTDMAGMFQGNQISDLKPLSNWRVDNVTSMSSMFVRNQISDLKPLSNWRVDNVTSMSGMFDGNYISNLLPLSNWHVDNVKDMSDMFKFNPIELADFRQWKFGQVEYLGEFIDYGINSVILTSSKNLSLLNGKSKLVFWSSELSLVTRTTPNSISINSDLIAMPTLYATDNMTTPAEELAEELVKQTRVQKIADYQKAHPTAKISLITPDPTNHSYDAPVIMANQKYRAVVSSKITYQFVDDDHDGAKVGSAMEVKGDYGSQQAVNLVVPDGYELASGQVLPTTVTIGETDTTVLVHLVRATETVVINFLDSNGSVVQSQTLKGKYGMTKQVNDLLPDGWQLLNGQKLPTKVVIGDQQTTLDYVIDHKVLFVDSVSDLSVGSLIAGTQGKHYPVGLTAADLQRTVKAIWQITMPNGSQQEQSQTFTFKRDALLDVVTGQITYYPWSANGQHVLAPAKLVPLNGYQITGNTAVVVTPDSGNQLVKVTYQPLQPIMQLQYVTADGQLVDEKTDIVAASDGMIHLTAPQGYRLLTSVTDVQVVRGSQKLAALVAPAEQTYTVHDDLPSGVTEPLTKTVTRTVKIMMPNGHIRTVKQSVKFERMATVDSVGHVTYGNWQAIGRAQFNKVFVPKRRGYHLVITDAIGKALTAVEKINAVTAEMNDAVVSVQYVKD